jgi:hypothetical protein
MSDDPRDPELCLIVVVLNFDFVSDLHLASAPAQLHTMVADVEGMREMAIFAPSDTDSHGHDRFGSFRLPFSYTKIETCSALTPSSRRLFPPLRLHPHPALGEGEYRRSGSDQRSQDQGILD